MGNQGFIYDVFLKFYHSKQEPKEKNHREILLNRPGLLSLASYITQDHLPIGGTSQSGLGTSISVIIKKAQVCLEMPLMEAFLIYYLFIY